MLTFKRTWTGDTCVVVFKACPVAILVVRAMWVHAGQYQIAKKPAAPLLILSALNPSESSLALLLSNISGVLLDSFGTMSISGTSLSTSTSTSSTSSSVSSINSLNSSDSYGTKVSPAHSWLSNFTQSTSSSSQSPTPGGRDRLCRDLNVWIPQSLWFSFRKKQNYIRYR